MKQLEVGHKIARKGSYGVTDIIVVERVTDTLAIAGERKFNRKIHDNRVVAMKAQPRFDIATYYFATVEHVYEYKVLEAREKLGKTNWNTVAPHLIMQIDSLVNS